MEMREYWVQIPLNKVVEQSKEKHKPEKVERLFYVGLEHIAKDSGELTKEVGFENIGTVKNVFRKGQLLYGKLRPYLNKAHLANREGVCSTDILVFDVCSSVLPEYLLNIFLSRGFVNDMSENTRGVNLPRVSTKYILNYKLNLPPLPEQRAIVSKIEQLFSELDNGIANLKAAKAKLETYRQAVLKKAFEGELTKEWRERQNRDLNLAAEPVAEYDQVKQSQTKKNGCKDLPEGWESQKLGEVGSWKGGGTPSKQRNEFWENGSILWVSPKDMKVQRISNTIDQISEAAVYESSAKWIDKGAILIVVRSGILRRKLPVAVAAQGLTVNQDIQTITPNDTLDSEFLYWFFISRDREIRQNCAKDGTTVDSINVPALKAYEIPVPKLEEQAQIVHEIESRLSVCDKLSESVDQSLEQAEALRQSILKKAFEGRLLSEAEVEACKKEPDWEPAEKLVARIERSRNERIGNQKVS